MKLRTSTAPTVFACFALFVAIGGSAFAAAKINGADIARGTVTAAQVKRGSITSKDIAPGAIGADRLSGRAGQLDEGDLITGDWSVSQQSNRIVPSRFKYTPVALGVKLGPDVTSSRINFLSNKAERNDADDECPGTVRRPTAPEGKICIYVDRQESSDPVAAMTGEEEMSDSAFAIRTELKRGTLYASGTWAYRAGR